MTTTVIEFLIEMRMLESQPQLRFPFILNILLLMWTVKKHKCHDDTCYVIRCHGPVSRLVVSCKLVICSCSRHATQRFVQSDPAMGYQFIMAAAIAEIITTPICLPAVMQSLKK